MSFIVIGADFVPTESNKDLFSSGKVNELLGEELLAYILSADYRIFNLEVPLTDHASPIEKQGPRLIAHEETIKGYVATGVNLFTLANNHILDQGIQGLERTKTILEANNISYVGIRNYLEEEFRPYIFTSFGKKFGVYACTEHEFSIATDDHAGANPYDPLESFDHINDLSNVCDYVIVLYHGGKEHYPYPSPMLQKRCHKMIEKGADIVICQHSHCIGCEEKYQNGTIVYGQGNFLFDHKNIECWKTGLLISIDERLKISYIPIVKQQNKVRIAGDLEGKDILLEFTKRGNQIKEKGFIEKSYCEFANEYYYKYMYAMGGKESFLFRVINKLTGNRTRITRAKRRFCKKELLAIQDYVECEAHRELLIRGIKNRINSDTTIP